MGCIQIIWGEFFGKDCRGKDYFKSAGIVTRDSKGFRIEFSSGNLLQIGEFLVAQLEFGAAYDLRIGSFAAMPTGPFARNRIRFRIEGIELVKGLEERRFSGLIFTDKDGQIEYIDPSRIEDAFVHLHPKTL